jgi:hypothetical protein
LAYWTPNHWQFGLNERLAHDRRLRDGSLLQREVEMKIFVVVLSSAFLTVAIASSFSSDAYAARRGSMSGMDNTYGSTKGKKCSGGACAPAGATGATKKKNAM